MNEEKSINGWLEYIREQVDLFLNNTTLSLDSFLSIIILISAASFVFYFILALHKNKSSIFYNESSTINNDGEMLKISEKISELEDVLSKTLLGDLSSLIDKEVNFYVNKNIDSIVKNKLFNDGVFKNQILGNLEKSISNEIDKKISKLSGKEIISLFEENNLKLERERTIENLKKHIDIEIRNTAFLKSFMINLFVMVNIGLFILYFFKASELDQYAVLSLSGLYISLVGFIIYIFKTSNSRSSVLLAIKEDNYKQVLSREYVKKIVENSSLSEFDIDFLKMLMTNHAEREKSSSHPYEIILKSISGSNIQLKDGKMNLGANKL